MSEQSSLPDRRITAADRETVDKLFSQVLDFPQEFKTWLLEFVPLYSTIFQEAVRSAAAAAGSAEHFIGEPFMWATTTLPELSLWCDGQHYAEVDYPELFDVIANTYDTYRGQSDPGAGRFRVPKYDGLVMVGYDGADALFNSVTDQGGSKNTVVVSHTHAHTHQPSTGASFVLDGGGSYGLAAGSTHTHASLTDSDSSAASGGVAGTNMNLQPYGVVRFAIYAAA